MSRPAHNFRLAAPLAAIGRQELSRFVELLQRRIELTSLLLNLLRDVPQVTALPELPRQCWNHYAPLLSLDVEHPRVFAEHLATAGVPNSTGTFRLVPLDQRPMFASDTPTCTTAAGFLGDILADERHSLSGTEPISAMGSNWIGAAL